MDFPFSYLFPDIAEGLRSMRHSFASNPHFEFGTVISPDQPKIPLDSEFWMKEKTRLLTEGVGFIKDDYANYFKVLIMNDGDGGCLMDGSVISMYCGFNSPQRVILSYQTVDNEFHMKVVDELGQEVKYLGLQFPEDQQTVRAVDPSHVFQSTFVDSMSTQTVLDVEPIQAVVQDDGGVFGFNNIDDVPFGGGQADMNGVEPTFTWEVNITHSMAEGRNVLHIPKRIEDVCFPLDQNSVVLVNQETEGLYLCAVATSFPPGRRTRRIGRGWYSFARDSNLKAGDKVIFHVTIAPEFLVATIVRGPVVVVP